MVDSQLKHTQIADGILHVLVHKGFDEVCLRVVGLPLHGLVDGFAAVFELTCIVLQFSQFQASLIVVLVLGDGFQQHLFCQVGLILCEIEVGEHDIILAAVGLQPDGRLHVGNALVYLLVQVIVVRPFVIILGFFGVLVDVQAQLGQLRREVGIFVLVMASVAEEQQCRQQKYDVFSHYFMFSLMASRILASISSESSGLSLRSCFTLSRPWASLESP